MSSCCVSVRRARPLLGTYVEILARGPNERPLDGAIDAAFDAIETVHRLMSVHHPDSDISRINRLAWRGPVEVHPWTARTLRWALAIHEATDGLFDCAVGHEMARWGVRFDCGLDDAQPGSLAQVAVSPAGAVRLGRRIGLDFGGIAKGFAVDRAIAVLRQFGVRSAVVNAGGDLRVMGHDAQPVFLRDPAHPGRARLIGLLRNSAVATSVATAASALVRLRDRAPILDGNAYTVVAPRCVLADALTKVVAQTDQLRAPDLERFGATAIVTPPLAGAA